MPEDKKYWAEMRAKSAEELHKITGKEVTCEESLKCAIAHVMKHGTCREAACAVVEGFEFMNAEMHLAKAKLRVNGISAEAGIRVGAAKAV